MMWGHLYKNFYITRASLIFLGVMQLISSAIYLTMTALTTASPRPEENAAALPLVNLLCYFMVFFLVGFTVNDMFVKDERPAWVSFSAATPSSSRGQVLSKYYCILAVYVMIALCCFFTDVIASIIAYNNAKLEVGSGFAVIVFIFSVEMLLTALEIPFVIRFGGAKGVTIKTCTFGAVLFAVFVYFLFGDISFIMGDDPYAEFIKWLNSSAPAMIIALLPYAAAAAFFISYKISYKIYRKGAENYGQ